MIKGSPSSIYEKANHAKLQNPLMLKKMLVYACIFEKFNKLKKDYESLKRTTRGMDLTKNLSIGECERLEKKSSARFSLQQSI